MSSSSGFRDGTCGTRDLGGGKTKLLISNSVARCRDLKRLERMDLVLSARSRLRKLRRSFSFALEVEGDRRFALFAAEVTRGCLVRKVKNISPPSSALKGDVTSIDVGEKSSIIDSEYFDGDERVSEGHELRSICGCRGDEGREEEEAWSSSSVEEV